MAQWLYPYRYRQKLTIQSTYVDASLTDFPMLIVTNKVNSSTDKKLAVTTSNGRRQCYVEVEKSTVSNAILWTKVPSIASGSDTVLYLYYDPVVIDNSQYVGDVNSIVGGNVWDTNFALVDHMQDDPNTSSTRDSTSNNNDGSKLGANEPIEATGIIAKGQSLDGINDVITVSHNASLNAPNSCTVHCWIKGSVKVSSGLIFKRGATIPYGLSSFVGDGQVNFQIYDGTFNPIARAAGQDWFDNVAHLVVGVRDIVSDTVKIYVDGVVKHSVPDTTTVGVDNVSDVLIGRDGENYFKTLLDEGRISVGIARSAAWIKASYYSEMNTLLLRGSIEDREASVLGGPPAPRPAMPIGLAVLLQRWLEAKSAS